MDDRQFPRERLDRAFFRSFGRAPERYFAAPGRTEIGGNHTDHQHGRVLAAAIDRCIFAAAAPNGSREIRLHSEPYPPCRVELDDLTPRPEEAGTTAALLRGIAAWFAREGCRVEGFDAAVCSQVASGSGLSSSAAFEVLAACMVSTLSAAGRFSPEQLARVGQYAENVYFGKPCGLMDQMACAVGGMVTIDFAGGGAAVRPVPFDPERAGYALCILDTHASHAELTDAYAAIPREMGLVAAQFGRQYLSEVEEGAFFARLPELRQTCGDRAVLRAMHFFRENARVEEQVQALERGDFPAFLSLVRQSGRSSALLLQNVTPPGGVERQDMALTLALCARALEDRGAWRVHGGGFAGTVQAFVPLEEAERFCANMDRVLGPGSCQRMTVRETGVGEVLPG